MKWKFHIPGLLVVAWLLLLPTMLVQASQLPCQRDQSDADKVFISVSPRGCLLGLQAALSGHVEPDTQLLLHGQPSGPHGVGSRATVASQGPVFAELEKTLVEASITDVQLLVPASMWPAPGATLEQLLLQPLFGQVAFQGLQMTNVIMLYETSDMRQAAAVLDAAVSSNSVQQQAEEWALNLYTDNATFAYMTGQLGGLQLNGVGVFVKPTPAAAAAGGGAVNYLLGVTNSTFIAALEDHATMDTPVPFFIQLTSNISWGQLLPQNGAMLQLQRHMYLAAQSGVLTAVDLASKVNQVALTGPHSNITFVGLVLENLGLGNSLSAQGAPGMSLVASINVWFLYWDRIKPRLNTNNCTLVVSSQREVEFLQYWGLVFSAQDYDIRSQASWLASGVGTTVWEADVLGSNSLAHKVVNRVLIAEDTLVTAKHRVFPTIAPASLLDPAAFGAAMKVQAGSPLVSVCNTNASLQVAMSALNRAIRGAVLILTAPRLSLPYEHGPGVAPEDADPIHILGNLTLLGAGPCQNSSELCNMHAGKHTSKPCSSQPARKAASDLQLQAVLLSKAAGAAQPLPGWPCNFSEAAGAHAMEPRLKQLGQSPVLDFAQQVDYIHLDSDLAGLPVSASLRDLTLRGLPQGPAVLEAAKEKNGSSHGQLTPPGGMRRNLLQGWMGGRSLTQACPDVWTLLMWSATREQRSLVSLVSVQLLLPAPEYTALLSAVNQQGQATDIDIVLEKGSAMHLNEVRRMGDCCIYIRSFEGPGIVGRDVLLLPDPDQAAAMPSAYLFPTDGSALQVRQSSQPHTGQLSPGGVAGVAIGAAAGLALLLAAGVFAVRHPKACNGWAAAVKPLQPDKHALKQHPCGAATRAESDSDASSSVHTERAGNRTASGMQRSNSRLPQLSPEQLRLMSEQAPASSQGPQPDGASADFSIVPDWGGISGSPNLIVEPVYEPVYGMFEALQGRAGEAATGPQRSTRGQRLTAAISDQVRSIHHSRLTSSMQASEASSRDRLPSIRTGGAGSASASASAGGASSSATGGEVSAAAAGDAASVAGDEAEADDGTADLMLHEVLGQGGFGVVYRATWYGADVAVKCIKLPPGSRLAAAERRSGSLHGAVLWEDPASAEAFTRHKRHQLTHPAEEMAVQEAAIGSSMSHPNLVAVYSISLHPMLKSTSQAGLASSNPDLVPYEMQIIQELCDQGTLHDALTSHLLLDRATGTNHKPTVLALALHVACAMQYLHKNQVLHSDLKASNVLLKLVHSSASSSGKRTSCDSTRSSSSSSNSDSGGSRGRISSEGNDACSSRTGSSTRRASRLSLTQRSQLVGKVSDFGLSSVLDPGATHMTKACGTPTHMAPELLMHGRCTRASDVYAYGILLWELATNGKPFADVPQPLLGHCVINKQLRPSWPSQLKASPEWQGLLQLVELCWCHDPHMRPTFTEIVAELQRLARGESPSASLTERLQRVIAEQAVKSQEAAAAAAAAATAGARSGSSAAADGNGCSSSSREGARKLEGLYGKWSLSWRRVFKPGEEKGTAAAAGSPTSSGGSGVGSSSSSSANAAHCLSSASGDGDAAPREPAATSTKPVWAT